MYSAVVLCTGGDCNFLLSPPPHFLISVQHKNEILRDFWNVKQNVLKYSTSNVESRWQTIVLLCQDLLPLISLLMS
jgi:hypothetical protein